MRIVQINKFFYLRGGAERHFFDLMHLLEEHGQDVLSFAMCDQRNTPSEYEKYFVSNISFDPPNLSTLFKIGRIIYSPEARRKLRALLKHQKPDIAHIHLMYHHLSPSILLELKKQGIPVVMTIHDWQALSPNYSLATKDHVYSVEEGKKYWGVVKERAIKNSLPMSFVAALAATIHHRLRWYEDTIDRLIAPSQFAKELFISYGWPQEKIVHIPHFVSSVLDAQAVDKQPFLLYAGRLSWEKGIDRLVRYWAEHRIPFTLKIAGQGPLQKEIEKIIDQYSLSSRIQMLGFVEPEDLKKIMGQAAAVIAPSVIYETFGLSIIESFAAGTGVIANRLGPFPELVEHTGAGELFDGFEGDGLARLIETYMDDTKKWAVYGQAGKDIAKERYSKERYYQDIMKVYGGLQ